MRIIFIMMILTGCSTVTIHPTKSMVKCLEGIEHLKLAEGYVVAYDSMGHVKGCEDEINF